MSGDPSIRPFVPGDFERMHAICAAAFAPIHAGFAEVLGPRLFAAHYREWQGRYGETIRAATAPDVRDRVHVISDAGVILGFVVTTLEQEAGVGEIALMAVDPAMQRRGLGRALLRFALDDLRACGATSVHVGTGGDAAHAPARALYAATGFGRAIPAVHYHREL
jgi:ribosomal protein S18 acetylase RimI-like enzyme